MNNCSKINFSTLRRTLPAQRGGRNRTKGRNLCADECIENIAGIIDHTLLRPTAERKDIILLCREAKKYGFAAVCVNPAYAGIAAKILKGAGVKVCTVIGFPLGCGTSAVKSFEAADAVKNGAEEIDMVINIGALKSSDDTAVLNDIKAVRNAVKNGTLKVIIETAYLTRAEKIKACRLAKKAGADFVKTSTGFGPGGAIEADVALMRAVVGGQMGVKASGGIKNAAAAYAMVKAGADRIGTSSGVSIVKEHKGL